jgi:tRNA(His) 5'-end guanylyltransferase
MFDSLGNRIKEGYENRTRYYLPRRTYTIVRIDGRAFSKWTRGLDYPFDAKFQKLIDTSALLFCKVVQGAVFAYTQSDEISILLIDFDPSGEKIGTDAWFDGNLQKICSVAASTFTAIFNESCFSIFPERRNPATFDCRAFTIADITEVYNYFVWRQNDATRNSIQASALSFYSHKDCFKKNCSELQEMVWQKGQNWNDYPVRFKRGGFIYYDTTIFTDTALNKKTEKIIEYSRPKGWSIYEDVPIFTSQEGRSWLLNFIPKLPNSILAS